MSGKTTTVIRHLIVVLKMPRRIGDQIIKAQFVQKALTGNVNFPAAYPANIVSLAQFGADIAALASAQTTAQSKTAGASDARNSALKIVLGDLRNLMQLVQSVADKNPANAESIILGAGYDIKKTAPKQKQIDAVKEGKVSGDVILTAKGAGAHEWQMSVDKIGSIMLDATTGARTTVHHLTSGDVYYFRNRPILHNAMMGDWCDWISIRVR